MKFAVIWWTFEILWFVLPNGSHVVPPQPDDYRRTGMASYEECVAEAHMVQARDGRTLDYVCIGRAER